MKNEFKVISKIIQNNKRVLDVGCGDGTLMEYLKKNQKNDVQERVPEKDQKLDRNLIGKMMPKGSEKVGFSFVLLHFKDFGLSRKRFKN